MSKKLSKNSVAKVKKAPKKAQVLKVKQAVKKVSKPSSNKKKPVKPVAKKSVKPAVQKVAKSASKPSISPVSKSTKPAVAAKVSGKQKPLSPNKAGKSSIPSPKPAVQAKKTSIKKDIVVPAKKAVKAATIPLKPVTEALSKKKEKAVSMVAEKEIKVNGSKAVVNNAVTKASITEKISTKSTPVVAEKAVKEPPGKFELEYVVHASAQILFEFLTSPSGLSEWFCDDVNIRNGIYSFVWEGSVQQARLIKQVDERLIRFQWLDKPDGSYFEFRIEKDDLTSDISLIITDFSENQEDANSSRLLWDSQVHKLLQTLGSYF